MSAAALNLKVSVSHDPNGRRMHGLNFRERKSFSVLITGFTRASLRPTPRTAAVNETTTEAEEEDEIEHDLSASLVDDMFDLTEQEKNSLHNAGT